MNIYYMENDAIKGERISCEFRKCSKSTIIHGSQKHRAKRLTLYNAFCVIENPLELGNKGRNSIVGIFHF